MRALWILPLATLIVATACGSSDTVAGIAANAPITIGLIDFDLSDWRYQVNTNPNQGRLTVVATNGNTCAILANPNVANVRAVHLNAFNYIHTDDADTTTATGPGTYPIQFTATVGPAGTVWFYATDADAKPLTPTNQPINPTTPFADNGNVIIDTFDPTTHAPVQGSSRGIISNVTFYYTFMAAACAD